MDLGNGSVGVLRVQGYWMVWDARQQKKRSVCKSQKLKCLSGLWVLSGNRFKHPQFHCQLAYNAEQKQQLNGP